MTGVLADHVWQSTAFAGIAALLALALRGHQARVRYWVWFSASLKFLVPFTLLFSLGSTLAWRSVEPKRVAPSMTAPLLQIGAPFTTEAPLTIRPPTAVKTVNRIDTIEPALLSVWALGFLTIAVMRYRAWRRIRLAIRTSVPWHHVDPALGPLEIRASPGGIEPGIVGFWKPVLLVPVGIDEHLTRLQWQTVIVHEQCHANRRDNLTAAVHMVIEAVFWFHPVVWWIGARLVTERERACDEYVLRTTSDPQAYAEAILSICKRHVTGSLACVSGVSGADLRARLEAIVANHVGRQLDAKRCIAVAVIAAAWVTAPVIAGALNGQRGTVQPGDHSAFEFADVHVSAPSTNPTMRGGALRGGRYEIRTATMVELISVAYDIETDKVLGGPNWLDWERFDVVASAPQSATQRDLRLMLQQLLADRFKLEIHKDTRLMPAFALSAGKGKPTMKAASGDGQPACQSVPQKTAPGATVQYLWISCRNVTMAVFADVLRGAGGNTYLADPVVDQTGLKGGWDFELKWTPRPRLAQAGADGITLFDAIEKQLGLRLEARKALLPVLRIESVNERPTPNAPGVAAVIPPARLAEFEVASIKPSAPDAVGFSLRMENGRMSLRNVTLKQLIQSAWDLSKNDEMIVGLPKSADADRFVVTAKVAVFGSGNVPTVDEDTLRLMLRGLLAERFGLKAHLEERPVEAYTLTALKKTNLQKADPQNRTHCKSGAGAGSNPMLNRGITCQNMSMAQFAAALESLAPNYVLTPVKDATGLEGYWDFSFNFSAVNLLPGNRFDPNAASGTSDPNGAVTLQEALEKQLGLTLGREKRPLPVLVVDHVEEKPTED